MARCEHEAEFHVEGPKAWAMLLAVIGVFAVGLGTIIYGATKALAALLY